MSLIPASYVTPVALAPILLVARRSRAQGDPGQMLVWLLVAGGVIAVVCGALAVVNRIAHARRTYSHAGLFAGLCQLHGLDRNARRLLKQVAQSYSLAPVARVFTEPGWLERASLGGHFLTQTADLNRVRDLLFASPQPRAKKANEAAGKPRPARKTR